MTSVDTYDVYNVQVDTIRNGKTSRTSYGYATFLEAETVWCRMSDWYRLASRDHDIVVTLEHLECFECAVVKRTTRYRFDSREG